MTRRHRLAEARIRMAQREALELAVALTVSGTGQAEQGQEDGRRRTCSRRPGEARPGPVGKAALRAAAAVHLRATTLRTLHTSILEAGTVVRSDRPSAGRDRASPRAVAAQASQGICAIA